MRLKLEVASHESLAAHDPIDLATDLCDACEGFMQSVKDLDDAVAVMDNIDNCILAFKNLDTKTAVASCNQDGALEGLLCVSSDKITTEMALEGLGDAAKKAWDWFCEKVKQFWNWLMKLLGLRKESLSKSADRLLETARKAEVIVKKAKDEGLLQKLKDQNEFDKSNLADCNELYKLCKVLSQQCSSVFTAGETAIASIKVVEPNGMADKLKSVISDFSSAVNKSYKDTANTVHNQGCSLTEKDAFDEAHDVKTIMLTVDDWGEFLPKREDSNPVQMNYQDGNLQELCKVAAEVKNYCSKLEKLLRTIDAHTKGAEGSLKTVTDKYAQGRIRNKIKFQRAVGTHASNTSSITERTLAYTTSNVGLASKILGGV